MSLTEQQKCCPKNVCVNTYAQTYVIWKSVNVTVSKLNDHIFVMA